MTSVDQREVATPETDAELAGHYRDRAEGLSADLDGAVEKLWEVGGEEGREWVSWNYAKTAERLRREDDAVIADAVLPPFVWTCADGYNHVLATPFGDVTVQAMGDGAGYAEPPWTPDAWIREPSVDAAKLAVQLDLLGRARSVVAGMAARGREWVKADG